MLQEETITLSSMNVRVLSDLHLEFDYEDYDPGEGDVLILAGDICCAVDIELMNDAGIIENDEKARLYDLVADLRQLPDDLPPPEELDEPEDHPMMKLMIEKGDWFMKIWPIQSISETRIASFDSTENYKEDSSHSDFIP